MKLQFLIVFLLIIHFASFLYSLESVQAKSTLTITAYLNPNKTIVGSHTELSIAIFNEGNETATIDSIKLQSPEGWLWQLKPSALTNSVIYLPANRTQLVNMIVTVPQDILGGNYKLQVLVSTNLRDYIVTTDLEVEKIESIPLSGDLPLSILVIVFSGSITYGIVVLCLTRKFDRNYFEVGVFSVGIGILNWYILYSSGLIETLDLVYTGVTNIATLLIWSIFFGLSISGSILVIKKLSQKINQLRERNRIANAIKSRGYAEGEGDKIWITYIKAQLDRVISRLGRRYTLTVRIFTKDSSTFEGTLYFLEESRPYDIILFPKFTVTVTDKNKIIEALSEPYEKSSSPVIIALRINSRYREKIIQWMKSENIYPKLGKWMSFLEFFRLWPFMPEHYYNKIVDNIRTRLQGQSVVNFLNDLSKIDFSKYSLFVVYRLIGSGNKMSTDYLDHSVYVPGDNINRVEILRFESAYTVVLNVGLEKLSIPNIYEMKEIPFIKDVTLD